MAEELLKSAVVSGDIRQVSTLIVESNVNINATDTKGCCACHVSLIT
jgi:hypothetical protein